jgi:hypothetical protein
LPPAAAAAAPSCCLSAPAKHSRACKQKIQHYISPCQ